MLGVTALHGLSKPPAHLQQVAVEVGENVRGEAAAFEVAVPRLLLARDLLVTLAGSC